MGNPVIEDAVETMKRAGSELARLQRRTEKMEQALREIAAKVEYYAPMPRPNNGSWLDDVIDVADIAREALEKGG
jgi:hypothetical protein